MVEEYVSGKWYAVLYSKKQAKQLFVRKIGKCFLLDEDGPVDSVEVCCLKLKVGSGTLLDDTQSHLPADISQFSLADVIYGPLEVVPMRAGKFDVLQYVVKHFNYVKKLYRSILI